MLINISPTVLWQWVIFFNTFGWTVKCSKETPQAHSATLQLFDY